MTTVPHPYSQQPLSPPQPDKPAAEAPMTAEAMLQALIKTNKAERDALQSDIDELTQEAKRLDTIREGLEAALRASRSAALRSVVPTKPKPPSDAYARSARTDWRG